MKVRYTLRAAKQIEAALDYLAGESPQAAEGLQERILTIVLMLQTFPFAGRSTTKRGIRRIALGSYPYLIDYRAAKDEIVIRRFRHAARRPVS